MAWTGNGEALLPRYLGTGKAACVRISKYIGTIANNDIKKKDRWVEVVFYLDIIIRYISLGKCQ